VFRPKNNNKKKMKREEIKEHSKKKEGRRTESKNVSTNLHSEKRKIELL